MPILWRPTMAIDNSIIDHDHQVLLSIVNDFDEAIPSMSGKAELERTLAKLHHYINVHMGREEHLQAVARFPERKDHHEQHGVLRRKLDTIDRKVAALDLSAIDALRDAGEHDDVSFVDDDAVKQFLSAYEEIRRLLHTWFVDHIIKSDRLMKPYVEAMRPYAGELPSLWNAGAASLAPNTDTPQAAKTAFEPAKTWMPARFCQEKTEAVHDQPLPPSAPKEHPAIARMRVGAQRAGLVLQIDTDCSLFKDQTLRDALSVWSHVGDADPAAFGVDLLRRTVSSFKTSSALFVRVAQADVEPRYFVSKAGDKFMRIFGAMEGQMLDAAMPGIIAERWQLLLNGVLEFGAPLRIIGRTNAFGRSDLMVEGLLAPFRDLKRGIAEVLAVASYDISI
jgi:hemerythrin